jgi:hypothetical protein
MEHIKIKFTCFEGNKKMIVQKAVGWEDGVVGGAVVWADGRWAVLT